MTADANKDGSITEPEAARYFAALRIAKTPAADGAMPQSVFVAHCKRGAFNAAKIEPGAPTPGANSFLEGQAKDRALAAGFTDISNLEKGSDGVWRGSAWVGPQSVSLTIDYKGNVVAN